MNFFPPFVSSTEAGEASSLGISTKPRLTLHEWGGTDARSASDPSKWQFLPQNVQIIPKNGKIKRCPFLCPIGGKSNQNGGKIAIFSQGGGLQAERRKNPEISSNSILSLFQFFGYFLKIFRGKQLFTMSPPHAIRDKV